MIPEKIRICGHYFNLDKDRLLDNLTGLIKPHRGEIILDDDPSSSGMQGGTIIHEVIHLADSLFNIFKKGDEKKIERQTNGIDAILSQVLTENPELAMAFFNEKEAKMILEKGTTLRICGHDVEVIVGRMDAFSVDNSTWGETNPTRREIRLDNGTDLSVRFTTLIREILNFGNGFFNIFDDDEEGTQERQVQSVASVIYQVFSENPVLLEEFDEIDGEDAGECSEEAEQ